MLTDDSGSPEPGLLAKVLITPSNPSSVPSTPNQNPSSSTAPLHLCSKCQFFTLPRTMRWCSFTSESHYHSRVTRPWPNKAFGGIATQPWPSSQLPSLCSESAAALINVSMTVCLTGRLYSTQKLDHLLNGLTAPGWDERLWWAAAYVMEIYRSRLLQHHDQKLIATLAVSQRTHFGILLLVYTSLNALRLKYIH